jgi:adenosine deaminase
MGELLTLPKAHLHVHLEGSIRARTLSEIAHRHRLELPACAEHGYRFRDFADLSITGVASRPNSLAGVARRTALPRPGSGGIWSRW